MRIGIIGAGQLGQMLGYAARDLDIQCVFIDPSPSPPAAACGEVIQAAFDDTAALMTLAETCDLVTYEFENVPLAALRKINDLVPVYPPPEALQNAQDRLLEKQLFTRLDIPLPEYHRVESKSDLETAAATIGLPLVLKTRRLGYDGKGQVVVKTADDIASAWQQLGGAALIAEQWVDFDYEVSAIGARNPRGDIICYPLTQNRHVDGILHTSRAPVEDERLTGRAEQYLRRLLEDLEYVGVLALELFVTGDQLVANEFAPRVHNSGHWSIEAAQPSQFTAHLLAISGADLTTPVLSGYAGMLNLIGNIPEATRKQRSGTLHEYGKEPKSGRKLGHFTVIAETLAERERLLDEIEQTVT